MNLRAISVFAVIALSMAACGSTTTETTSDTKAGPKTHDRDSSRLVETSPMTGLPMKNGQPKNSIFAVKVENTVNGKPQYGLNKADLVVDELVEGGLTRLAAFYYSNLPKKVGHVRSIRGTDVGLAAPVNAQVVTSGGAGRTYKQFKAGGIKVFASDHRAPGFSNDPSKVRPYNKLVNLQTVRKKARVTPPEHAYLSWTRPDSGQKKSSSPGAKSASKKVSSADVGFSNSTHSKWSLRGKKWRRVNSHAARGQDFKADTLLVLFAKVGDAGYKDPAGNPVPETIFKGSGNAVVLHGNEMVKAKWSKKTLASQITFKDSDGSALTIDPGRVWIELVPQSGGSFKAR